MARGGWREALEILFLGPRESVALLGVPGLWKVETQFWFRYLARFLPLDIWLQGRPQQERPFGDFRFGETPYFTAQEILKEARLQPGETFLDLGCGRGKMVFAAALGFGARAIGVDLLATYIKIGRRVADFLGIRNVEFRLEDFTLMEVYDADVIYIAGSIFELETREELLALVEQLQPGSRWITVGWPSHHPLLKLESQTEYLFSWGYEQAYQYVVLDDSHFTAREEFKFTASPADAIADPTDDPEHQVEIILEDGTSPPASQIDSTEGTPIAPGREDANRPPQN